MERDAREMVRAHKAGEGVDPDSARIYVEAMEPSALRSELIRTHRKWNSEGRVVEVEKGVLESWLDQATQLQNVGDHIRALEVCQDRLLDYPEDYWALSKQAWSYLEMSRYGESEPLFRRAAELAERAGDHHQASREYNNLGLTLWRQKKTVRAEAEFRLAIREAKRAGDHALAAIARSNLGVSLWKPGTEEEAVKEFRLAIGEAECAGDDAAAVQSHFNLGASLGLQGKWEQAEEEFRRAIELNPAFMKAALGLFDVLVHRLRERGWESVTAGVVELLDHTKGAEAIQLSGFLPAVVQTRHTKELLDLLEVADVGGEWMLVREALKGVDDPASVERLVPEVRERVRALVAEITGKAAR